eukprot:CAMPEP_0172316914 /NCGR_PEP_ID=MMETSP1058-20130122/29952_1 /TAXON_ID=83371 /ORGANISM="Detonula confervacea, Strain CCMP 353" /LENGTH=641 /DNA_ID=CAMNT_0013031353 /DNA_START=86 /DNA_END=2008 /DNA_ORIENTATION=+
MEDSRDGNSHSSRHSRRGPNVVILSVAGKPIFVRYGSSSGGSHSNPEEEGEANEDEWATACGIIQGLRANILSFGLSGLEKGASSLGDIQSLNAGSRMMVFKHTEALTLVSISDRKDGNHNEAWLRLQLEYVYSQVIFTLTSQVQSIFKNTPSYDLRSMMGPNVNDSIRNLLDRFDPVDLDEGIVGLSRQDSNESISKSSHRNRNHGTGCGSFLTAGVECIHPIPPEIRENASKMLIHACGKGIGRTSDLFAILTVGTRLVTIVQPPNPSSQLHTSDLHLILTFVGRQPGLLTNELWFPLCLPRFDSSGFLYAYTSCLDPMDTGLSIVLISPDNSTEQFKSYHNAANTVRKTLGLPSVRTKVLRVFDSSSNVSTASSASTPAKGNIRYGRSDSAGDLSTISIETGDSERKKTHLDDAAWKTKYESSNEAFDEDDKDGDGKGIARRISQGSSPGIIAMRRPTLDSQISATCYLENFLEDDDLEEDEEKETNHEAPLLTALKVALSAKQQEEMMTSYLQLASAVHFVFRCDIYVNSGSNGGGSAPSKGEMLTQCFGPPLSFPFTDASSQSHVWDVYQRLSLRLRLGSSSVETTMDALDMITNTHQHDDNIDSGDVSQECPMQCLLESPPNVHSVTYLQEDNEW